MFCKNLLTMNQPALNLKPIMDHVHGWRTNWIGLGDDEIAADERQFWEPLTYISPFSVLSCACWLEQSIGFYGALDHKTGQRWDSSSHLSYQAWCLEHPDQEPIILKRPVALPYWLERSKALTMDTFAEHPVGQVPQSLGDKNGTGLH